MTNGAHPAHEQTASRVTGIGPRGLTDRRWQLAILLCTITTINYLDRQAFAVASPAIVEQFDISNTRFGEITAAFLFFYGLGHLIVGPLIDRFGTRRAFSTAVVAWSVVGILHSAARGYWSFLVCRSLLGLFEAANFPAAVKAIAEKFTAKERTVAVGILTVGPGLGAVLAPPLLGVIIVWIGWRWAFIVPGLAGFIWLLWWRRLYPAQPSVADDAPSASGSGGLRRHLRRVEVWGLLVSRALNDGAFYFFVGWLPLYLAQARGFSLVEIAAFAWIPFLAADVGSLVGGYLGRFLISRGQSLDASRKTLIWAGTILVVVSLPAGSADSAVAALALIAVAMFAIQLKAASLFALPADLFPSTRVGTIWGWFGAAGAFGASAFNQGAGWVSEHYAYEPVFWAMGITQILSAIVISWFVPEIRNLEAEPR